MPLSSFGAVPIPTPFTPSDTDRQLGWLIGLGGLVLGLGNVPNAITQLRQYPSWWALGSIGLLAAVLLLALLGRHLPGKLLGSLWITIVSGGFLLQIFSFWGVRGATDITTLPWIWELEPVFVGLLVLLVSTRRALGLAALFALSPAISALIFTSQIPEAILVATPIHLGNIIFVVIFLALRTLLAHLRLEEATARSIAHQKALAVAKAQRQAELSRFIHDEILSILNAALCFSGPPPAELQAEAQRTIRLLDLSISDERQLPLRVSSQVGAALLNIRLSRLCPPGSLTVESSSNRTPDPGTVDSTAVEAIGAAALEAVRNSLRHAGPSAQLRVKVAVRPDYIFVSIIDQGIGFDALDVDPNRLGLRGSIRDRMIALPGGNASIESKPGEGTRIDVEWNAP